MQFLIYPFPLFYGDHIELPDSKSGLEPSLTSDEALLAGVQVEVVEGVVDGLDLAHLDEPHLPTHPSSI